MIIVFFRDYIFLDASLTTDPYGSWNKDDSSFISFRAKHKGKRLQSYTFRKFLMATYHCNKIWKKSKINCEKVHSTLFLLKEINEKCKKTCPIKNIYAWNVIERKTEKQIEYKNRFIKSWEKS